jgi:hypothetical protein
MVKCAYCGGPVLNKRAKYCSKHCANHVGGLKGPFQKGNSYAAKGGAASRNKDPEQQRKNATTHGLSRHPFYITFYMLGKAIVSRCCDPTHPNYRKYGAIGIQVWEPWEDVVTFVFGITALLGDRPEGYSIDRINPWEGYYEWNVRWADLKTQRWNIRENIPDFYSQSGEH